MYYLANYNEKQKIHRGEQTNAFPSWQLTDGLEPGNGYLGAFGNFHGFPWRSITFLQMDLLSALLLGLTLGEEITPRAGEGSGTRALCPATIQSCSPGGKSPGWDPLVLQLLAGGTGTVPEQRVCARRGAGGLGWL